jgi:catechol 2,3-dioxygenase-like lactoylglutathione lyase family enzyme
MGKGFTISRVGHVGIHVTDMDRSLAWYRDILGLTLTGRWAGARCPSCGSTRSTTISCSSRTRPK